MPQPDEQLPEQFARLGFDYQDMAPRIREIDPTLSESSIQFRDPRSPNPGDYFAFTFEFWRKKPEDPLTITCLSAALISHGVDGQEELVAMEYYHFENRAILPKEAVIGQLLDLRRRELVNQKFNMGRKPSNTSRRRRPPPRG